MDIWIKSKLQPETGAIRAAQNKLIFRFYRTVLLSQFFIISEILV